ncbi:MAG TPA: molecular chaperone TorD family protein [Thermoanaerobaculia bacterium]|nr:molecular chaperone TorD family protein [Thermoanaerobaculia bacterium]
MTAAPTLHRTLRRAAHLHLIGLLFERPRPGWSAEVRTLAAELEDVELRASLDELEGFSEGRYLRLLGPGGALSPREVGYQPMGDPGKILADLGAYYQAFAYRPGNAEPLDHVAVETGFLAYLALKESYAEEGGDPAAAAVCRSASRSFADDHLRALAHGVACRLEHLEAAAPQHLLAAARTLADLVGPESARGGSLPILGQALDPFAAEHSPCGEGIFDQGLVR